MTDFNKYLENPSLTLTELNFDPIPEQKLWRGRNAPKLKTGALVQQNGDVLFRILAPTASEVVIEVSRLAQKYYQQAVGYDKDKLIEGSHMEKDLKLPLAKQDNGCFEGTLKYSPIVAGYRSLHVHIDGAEVIYPYIPVCYIGDHYSNFIEVPDPAFEDLLIRDVPHGSVSTDIYWSKVMNRWVRQLVYTPPGYRQSAESYPAVYLQEGRTELETAWVSGGKVPQLMDNLIAAGKAVPAIIVMNNGMLRTPEDGTERYDGFIRMICEDTIPYVEANYRVKADKWNRGFAGLSMGGMQACQGGLSHPELFAWLGLFSCSIRMRDVELDFAKNEHLKLLLDRETAEKEFRLIYRANGIGEQRRDQIILDDDDWIKEKRIDSLGCYRREVIRENGGEHEWTTFRRSFYNFIQMTFR